MIYLPVLTYSAESWPVTKSRRNKVPQKSSLDKIRMDRKN